MCMNNDWNNINFTYTLCRISLQWNFSFSTFCVNVQSLATSVICFFLHYSQIKWIFRIMLNYKVRLNYKSFMTVKN